MEKDITFRVATGLQQWVGYWGQGESLTLAQSLAKLVQQQPTSWKISTAPDRNGFLSTLSAAGLSPTTVSADTGDAWVKVESHSLTLGRQAFGRVPLYWLQQGQVIWFASRLQLLRPLIPSPTVNLAALYGYSCFSYVPTPLTPVAGIVALAAGTQQTWQMDAAGHLLPPETSQLWHWQEMPETITDEPKAIAHLQTLLKSAVERQTADLGNEPVGVLLSGGLDSSIVAALLVQAGVKVQAYTLDLGESSFPEYPYAEQVAAWLKIPLIKVKASPRQIHKALIPTIRALDLPFGDGVTVPLYLLKKAASQDVRVVFNGEGGDQLFAGWTNKPLIAANLYQAAHPEAEPTFEQHYLRTFHRLWGYEEQVFQPQLWNKIQSLRPVSWLYPALDPTATRSLLHRLRRASLMLKGAQNIHPRATNLGFAHHLQVRSPFCDLPLAQWTFHLAGELCLQGTCEKYILKKAVESWLPPEIVWRQKRGMGVPLTAWCLNQWWQNLGGWLNPGTLLAEGRWQPSVASRVAFGELGGLIQGRRIGEILWLLIVWQLWRVHILGEAVENTTWNHPFWLPYSVWRLGKQWR